MSHSACRYAIIRRARAIFASLVIAGLALAGIATGLAQEEKPGEVESRGMPQIQKPMQPGMPVQPGAPAQQKFQLPTWPQKWDVNNREPYGVAFGVTQPGPVTVDVQSQGAPVVVELYGTAPQAVQRQAGNGTIRLMYQVTPADIQRGVLWQARIALAQPGGPPAQAAGTIGVQHPPADVNAVRAQVQARIAQRRIADPQAEAAMKAKMDASIQAEMAKFQQEQTARRAAMLAEIQSKPLAGGPPPLGQIQPRGLEAANMPPEEPVTPAEGDVASRGGLRSQFGPSAAIEKAFQEIRANLPTINGFSLLEAQPGDPVQISGSKFATAGQVLVVLKGAVPGAGVPLAAPVQWWRDTLIQITVPDVSGIATVADADVVIVRGVDGMRSDPQNDYGRYFRVQPALEIRELSLPPSWADSYVHFPEDNSSINVGGVSNTMAEAPPGWCEVGGFWDVCLGRAGLFGDKGYDEFFMTKTLKNGWKVSSIYLGQCYRTDLYPCGDTYGTNGAYVVESQIGSVSPRVKVRSWATPFWWNDYYLQIMIKGPKGVPYE